MIKIIFLDFDGVLTSIDGILRGFKSKFGQALIDPEYVARLNRIIDATNAVCVVSSTWRQDHTLIELQQFLDDAGFTGKLIDVTKKLHLSPYKPTERAVCRGDEIQLWLDAEADPGVDSGPVKFVILDDDSDMDNLIDRLVKTSWEHGLQDEHVERAIKMLNE